jgi:serine/threonine-protein kinase
MSPEQARGQKVDRRCDIWSFGVVLYEMLSGKKAFIGDTVSDTLASVLKSDPEWKALPDSTPVVIRSLVRRCLERDPKSRLQSIGEARIAIGDYLAKPGGETAPGASPAASWRRALPWGIAALAAGAAVVLGLAGRGSAPESPLRVSVGLGERPLYLTIGSSISLSPDGTRLAYVEGDDTGRRLLVRPLDQLEPREIVSGAGSGAAPYHPFFSPDGEWLGYVTSDELRKVPVGGGTSLTLTKLDRSRGASWGPDGTIVFTRSPESGLFRVSASGGEPIPLTTLDEASKEVTHRWPQFLPGGKAVLFTSHTQSAGGFDNATIEVVVVESGERKIVHRGGSNAVYVPSGHLVYASQGTLFSVPFDPATLETKGSAAPVVQDVAWSITDGGAQFTISDTGRLAIVQGENTVPEFSVVWVDREGSVQNLWSQPGSYGNPRLSPDGKKLSLTVLRNDNWDIWIYDLERGVPTRLTFDDAQETEQIWSPDGEFLIYGSALNGPVNMYRKRSDGSGEAERLTESDKNQWPTSWSRDGRHVAFVSSENAFDIEILTLGGEVEKFLSTPYSEADPAFSPDGRFIAYDSSESGQVEVYVRSFPAGGGKWQVSDGGGAYPKWSRDGRALYYRTDQGIMAASIEASGGSFRAGKPRSVLEGSFRGGIAGVNFAGNSFADYDVSFDGKRFVMFPAAQASGKVDHPHVVLSTGFFDTLPR